MSLKVKGDAAVASESLPVLFDAGADAQMDDSGALSGPDLRSSEPLAELADMVADRRTPDPDASEVRPDGSEAGLELVASVQSVGGVPIRVLKQDHYVFLGDWNNLVQEISLGQSEHSGSVQSYDVADLLHPLLRSTLFTPDQEVQDLAIDGHWMFVANDNWGLRLVDLSRPEDLTSVTNRAKGMYATSVVVTERGTSDKKQLYALVGYLYGGGLDIHAVPDGGPIPAPTHYTSSAMPSRCDVYQIQVRGDRGFILTGDGATKSCVEILDLSQLPAVPTVLGRYCYDFSQYGSIGDLRVTDNLAFLAASDYLDSSNGGLLVIDFQDEKQPSLAGRLDLAGVGSIDWKGSGLALGQKGEVFFMTSTGVQAIDVSVPAKPIRATFAAYPKGFGACQGGTAVFEDGVLYVGAYCTPSRGQGGLAIYRRH